MLNPTIERARRQAERWLNRIRLRRKRAYVALFVGDAANAGLAAMPDAAIVLADLAKFCRAFETCFDPDPRVAALLEGRREVWLRISGHLNLTEAEMIHLDPVKPEETDDE